jgi:hypothetical protein
MEFLRLAASLDAHPLCSQAARHRRQRRHSAPEPAAGVGALDQGDRGPGPRKRISPGGARPFAEDWVEWPMIILSAGWLWKQPDSKSRSSGLRCLRAIPSPTSTSRSRNRLADRHTRLCVRVSNGPTTAPGSMRVRNRTVSPSQAPMHPTISKRDPIMSINVACVDLVRHSLLRFFIHVVIIRKCGKARRWPRRLAIGSGNVAGHARDQRER